jgi:hypothetical protein
MLADDEIPSVAKSDRFVFGPALPDQEFGTRIGDMAPG